MLDVFTDSIEDIAVRDAIEELIAVLQSNPFIRARGDLITYQATSAVTNQRIAHQLPFKPKHAVLLSKTGSSTVTFLYDNFTDDAIYITTSGATEITAFVGTLSEDL